MAAPQKLLAGLMIVLGALILGFWIPLSEIMLSGALAQGGFLANLTVLGLFALIGLGLLLWGWHLLRKPKRRTKPPEPDPRGR